MKKAKRAKAARIRKSNGGSRGRAMEVEEEQWRKKKSNGGKEEAMEVEEEQWR